MSLAVVKVQEVVVEDKYKKKVKLSLWIMGLMFCSMNMFAQLNDPRERFSLSATVDGTTNTDFTWKSREGESLAGGRLQPGVNVRVRSNVQLFANKMLSVSLAPFYNFSNAELRTRWGAENLGFTLPTEHHHYGGTLMLNGNLLAFGKPLTLLAMGTGNFSQYGYENASGMMGGMIFVTRNQRTVLGLGAIYLLGSAVSWPLYPLIIYSHKFDDRWSINCMEAYNYLYYQASPMIKYSVGMELETDKFYFRPHQEGLPKKAMYSQVSERVGLFADIQATKELSLHFGAGVQVPFYGRLRESGYNHNYMTLRDEVKPFVNMRVKYSLMRKPQAK